MVILDSKRAWLGGGGTCSATLLHAIGSKIQFCGWTSLQWVRSGLLRWSPRALHLQISAFSDDSKKDVQMLFLFCIFRLLPNQLGSHIVQMRQFISCINLCVIHSPCFYLLAHSLLKVRPEIWEGILPLWGTKCSFISVMAPSSFCRVLSWILLEKKCSAGESLGVISSRGSQKASFSLRRRQCTLMISWRDDV